jgi:hypothetical protein
MQRPLVQIFPRTQLIETHVGRNTVNPRGKSGIRPVRRRGAVHPQKNLLRQFFSYAAILTKTINKIINLYFIGVKKIPKGALIALLKGKHTPDMRVILHCFHTLKPGSGIKVVGNLPFAALRDNMATMALPRSDI